MADPVIVNQPPQDNSSGANTVLLIVIIVLILVLGYWGYARYYRAPAEAPADNDSFNVDVNLPGSNPDTTE